MSMLTASIELSMTIMTNKCSTQPQQTPITEQQKKQLEEVSNYDAGGTENDWSHAATVGSRDGKTEKSGSDGNLPNSSGHIATAIDQDIARVQLWLEQQPSEEPWSLFNPRCSDIKRDPDMAMSGQN